MPTAYDVVMPVPLEEILGPATWRSPASPASSRTGRGARLGQRRTLRFTDGGSATEVLSVLEAPQRFGYRLTEVRAR